MNAMKKLCNLLLLAWMSFSAVSAQTTAAPTTAQIEALLEEYNRQNLLSGVFFVAKDGKPIFQKAFGYADVEKNQKNLLNTRFNVAGMGKHFTALLVLQLVEKRQLELHAPISRYLPASGIPNADRITIHHLLSHTSGLGNYMDHPAYAQLRPTLTTLAAVMKLVASQPLVFSDPGKNFSYSNSGYLVLGRVLEKVTGISYASYVKQTLFRRLGMGYSTVGEQVAQAVSASAVPYFAMTPKDVYSAASWQSPAFSDGGVYTTVLDLFKYSLALNSNKLLSKKSKALMFGVYHHYEGKSAGYGYGAEVATLKNGSTMVGHSGGGHGWGADFRILPKEGYIIIGLGNQEAMAKQVTHNLANFVTTGTWHAPKPLLTHLFMQTVQEKGWAYALDHLEELYASAEVPFTGPGILTRHASKLVKLHRQTDAIHLLQALSSRFPTDAATAAQLAEAYLAKGDQLTARQWYEKTLSLDRQHQLAKFRLQEMAVN